MTTNTLLMYMTTGEIAILAIVVSIYLVLRARKNKHTSVTHKVVTTVTPTAAEPGLELKIQQLIQQTRKRLNGSNEQETQVLEARIQFLEAEAALLSDDPLKDAYWASVSEHLASLFPAITDTNEETQDTLAELDDIDTNEKPKGSIQIDTSREEIGRLRNIISRQHGSIDDLKHTLLDQQLSATQSEALSKKLEQIEVAHAQLNMCVEVLEKENHRLNELLESSDQGSDSNLEEARQQLHDANERIDDLVHENASKSERIEELESEISSLQEQLEEHERQLRQAELMNADLSLTESDNPIADPDVLREQIESISELLMRKSGELQLLQSGDPNAPNSQRMVQAALHEASLAASQKKSSSEVVAAVHQDDIPVLEPIAEDADDVDAESEAHIQDASLSDGTSTNPTDKNDSSPPDFGVTSEDLDDSDITPAVAEDDVVGEFDDHDIVVEDDYLDDDIEDEINSFLFKAESGINSDDDVTPNTPSTDSTEDIEADGTPAPARDTKAG